MRRPLSTRFGALGLALLLQVFVASPLLHPCCLAMGMEATAASVGAVDAEHAPAHGSHGATAGAHAPSADHGASDAAAHAGHAGHDAGEEGGCDGACGFCCQAAGVFGVPAAPLSVAALDLGLVHAPTPVQAAVLVSATAHLRPWANAPPTPRSASA